VTNLGIGTQAANMKDRYFHNTDYCGDRNPSAKLDLDSVNEIRTLKGSMSAAEAGFLFGVSRACIQRVWSGEAWGDSRPDVIRLLDSICDAEHNTDKAEIIRLIGQATWSKDCIGDLMKAEWYLRREINRLSLVDDSEVKK
jgi:hypothetical protein